MYEHSLKVLMICKKGGGDCLPVVLKPQKGPQEDFLSNKADIVIYGGAAGGG